MLPGLAWLKWNGRVTKNLWCYVWGGVVIQPLRWGARIDEGHLGSSVVEIGAWVWNHCCWCISGLSELKKLVRCLQVQVEDGLILARCSHIHYLLQQCLLFHNSRGPWGDVFFSSGVPIGTHKARVRVIGRWIPSASKKALYKTRPSRWSVLPFELDIINDSSHEKTKRELVTLPALCM